MRRRFLLAGLLLFAAGCGAPRIVPVSGRVTLHDKPLANATVMFQPLSEEENPGPGSQGKTDSDGKFILLLLNGQEGGALVGRHKVSITAYEGDDTVPSSGSDIVFRKALLGEEYNARSKLTFEVPPGGTTDANFGLPMR